MTPGTFIRLRREAKDLTLVDVATRLPTQPPVCAHSRAEWLATIEANIAPISVGTAIALYSVLRFDGQVLEALMRRHAGATDAEVAEPQLCRRCACSWFDACSDAHGACSWVPGDPTLCTRCATRAAAAPPALVAA